MDPEQESAADIALVRKHSEQLGEHFDSVQIFVTRHEPATRDGTVSVNLGVGNWFSRYGQICEWIVKQDEWTRMKAQKDE